MFHRSSVRLLSVLLALAAMVFAARTELGASGTVSATLSPFSTGLTAPIGIDQVGILPDLTVCSVQRTALVASVNWFTGVPNNLEIFDALGQHQPFGQVGPNLFLAGLPTELKVGAIHVA